MKKMFIGIIAMIALAGAAMLLNGYNLTGSASAKTTENIKTDVVKIPVSDVTENAKWYEFSANGVTVRFFAVKADDGSVKTAFDACDVCYKAHKGYSQNGKYMVCNNCGNRYPIDGLGSENKNPGGCWPSYLLNKVIGNDVLIQKSDLEMGRAKFA